MNENEPPPGAETLLKAIERCLADPRWDEGLSLGDAVKLLCPDEVKKLKDNFGIMIIGDPRTEARMDRHYDCETACNFDPLVGVNSVEI